MRFVETTDHKVIKEQEIKQRGGKVDRDLCLCPPCVPLFFEPPSGQRLRLPAHDRDLTPGLAGCIACATGDNRRIEFAVLVARRVPVFGSVDEHMLHHRIVHGLSAVRTDAKPAFPSYQISGNQVFAPRGNIPRRPDRWFAVARYKRYVDLHRTGLELRLPMPEGHGISRPVRLTKRHNLWRLADDQDVHAHDLTRTLGDGRTSL